MTPVCDAGPRPFASPRWQIVAATCACAAVSTYVYSVDPARGTYPHCLLYQATGLYCAGCGATRALHALLHGRGFEALHDNVLFVTLLPGALALAVIYACQAWSRNAWPAVAVGQKSLVFTGGGLVAAALAFAVLRNVPGAPFDLLRPVG